MMTRKDFTKIAAVLAGDLASSDSPEMREKIRGTTLSLADMCAQANPSFDRARFYKAVGLTGGGMLPERVFK